MFGQEDKGEIRGQSRTGSKAEGHFILEGAFSALFLFLALSLNVIFNFFRFLGFYVFTKKFISPILFPFSECLQPP